MGVGKTKGRGKEIGDSSSSVRTCVCEIQVIWQKSFHSPPELAVCVDNASLRRMERLCILQAMCSIGKQDWNAVGTETGIVNALFTLSSKKTTTDNTDSYLLSVTSVVC